MLYNSCTIAGVHTGAIFHLDKTYVAEDIEQVCLILIDCPVWLGLCSIPSGLPMLNSLVTRASVQFSNHEHDCLTALCYCAYFWQFAGGGD